MEGMGISPMLLITQLINLVLIGLVLGGFFVIVVALRSIASSLHALADKQPPPHS